MKEYRTNALPLASYLSCVEEVKFLGADKSEPGRVVFRFEPYEIASQEADDYFAGKKKTFSPLDFSKNYRSLKDLVFEVKRNAEYRSN